MEICSWDWGAIATFTASGMALIISHQWRIQKRSERSSEIAKETYKSLLFVRNQITEYVNHCRKLNVYSNRALSFLTLLRFQLIFQIGVYNRCLFHGQT